MNVDSVMYVQCTEFHVGNSPLQWRRILPLYVSIITSMRTVRL